LRDAWAGGGATMVYDGNGNRVSKTVAGLTTNFLISEINPTGFAQVVSESFSGGTGNREESHAYVYGLDRISQNRLAFINSQNITQISYYVYDGHGSVRALTDSSGNVTDTYDYDAFGNEIHTTTTLASPTVNEFLFVGEQFDSDLHLYYNRARYLYVQTGRFLTADILKEALFDPSELQLYLYSSNDAVDRVDPSGEQDTAEELTVETAFYTLAAFTSSLILTQVLKNVKFELPVRLNHYTRWEFIPSIMLHGIDSPSGNNYFTSDFYLSQREAKAKLALPKHPQVGINLILYPSGDALLGPDPVPANFGEIGGGEQYRTGEVIPFWSRAPVLFPLF
jgi:RHS repeat-associated protein